MPFTLAHPAVVLPLTRVGLPLVALVAGSMSPDVPLFVPWPVGYELTHSLLGVVTADLAVSVACVALWVLVLRDALVDLSPAPVRHRLPARSDPLRQQWLVVPAAVVGALSHVVWDDFTHRGRWAVERIAWLHTQHGPIAGYQWAQYVSGVLGVLVMVIWAGRSLSASTTRRTDPPLVSWMGPRVLVAVLLATLTAALVTAGLHLRDGLHAVAYHAAVVAVPALVLGLTAGGVTWQTAAGRARRRRAAR